MTYGNSNNDKMVTKKKIMLIIMMIITIVMYQKLKRLDHGSPILWALRIISYVSFNFAR